MSAPTPRLRLAAIRSGYGGGTVLHGVDLAIPAGGVHAVVGANGAGKTTLLHTIAGLVRATGGRIMLDGRDVTALATHRRARAGVALVPQGRRVFASLSVAEHLAIAYRRRATVPRRRSPAESQAWDPPRVLELLPQLAARLRHRGGQLSGGEQQMLAIARALLGQPRLLLLDEPTEGLAPALVDQIRELLRGLATGGSLTILLAAPHPELPVAIADEITVLRAGRATGTVPAAAARLDPEQLHAALTPAAAAIS